MYRNVLLTAEAKEILNKIRSRRGNGYKSTEFENDLRDLLSAFFPYSVISNIRLFSAENRLQHELGIEIDNLMHFRFEGTDYLVVVEAKNQKLRVEGKKWIATYDGQEKCARDQVDAHVQTLWEYLEPVSRDVVLKFVAIVCSAHDLADRADAGYRNAELHLLSVDGLIGLLGTRFNLRPNLELPAAEVLRASQSKFLNLLRLSLPVPELGHPELSSAIRYVERCRRALDDNLFQDFKPTAERWVINGSAGMGKSVLLAYTAAVLCSGYELDNFHGEVYARTASDTLEKIGFKADSNSGSIVIMAMSAKQLDNLRGWFELFTLKFQKGDEQGNVRFKQPEFILCRDATTVSAAGRRCCALLVDEAHDLPGYAAAEIATTYQQKRYYLVVACDRHQKLRLAGSDAAIIEGLDFTNKSRRLKQIYRNPVPVYIASLALMFRWFASSGPKVIPKDIKDLADHFGFVTERLPGNGISLTIKSDAHPANSWSHTVATFPNADAAFVALTREPVEQNEVLWMRFSEEDPDFDYEQLLGRFTYHNCRSEDAYKISDKYVKGQEYPIVVIEGFPKFMDRFSGGDRSKDHEEKMWAFRRELYLCASRATCFLYFICNVPDSDEILRIKQELQRLVEAVALPKNLRSRGARSWQLFLQEPGSDDRRDLNVFRDAMPPLTEEKGPTDNFEPQPLDSPSQQSVEVSSSERSNEEVTDSQEDEGARETERTSSYPATAPPPAPVPEESTALPPTFSISSESGFARKLTVSGSMSVEQIAKGLGVHRSVILKFLYLRNPRQRFIETTMLDVEQMRMVAAKQGFGIEIKAQSPRSVKNLRDL